MISSNFGPIFYRFRDTTTYSLRHFIENCGQTAADEKHGYYWQPIGSCQCPIRWYHRRPPTTYRLTTIHPLRTTDRRQTITVPKTHTC